MCALKSQSKPQQVKVQPLSTLVGSLHVCKSAIAVGHRNKVQLQQLNTRVTPHDTYQTAVLGFTLAKMPLIKLLCGMFTMPAISCPRKVSCNLHTIIPRNYFVLRSTTNHTHRFTLFLLKLHSVSSDSIRWLPSLATSAALQRM